MKISLKVVLIGDSFVGKTSMTRRYVLNSIHHGCCIGPDFLLKEIIMDDKPLNLQIWDTFGQERFQGLVASFYRNTDCCILSFDVTKESSFINLDHWKQQFEEMISKSGISNKEIATPFVLFANKIDLTEKRVISRERIDSWCKENGNIPYFEVSAKEATNINEAFTTTAKLAFSQYLVTHTDEGQIIPLSIPPVEEPKITTCC